MIGAEVTKYMFERAHCARGERRTVMRGWLATRRPADVEDAAREGFDEGGNQDRLTLAKEVAVQRADGETMDDKDRLIAELCAQIALQVGTVQFLRDRKERADVQHVIRTGQLASILAHLRTLVDAEQSGG